MPSKRVPWNKKYPDYFICNFCGKKFRNITGHPRKFCNKICYGKNLIGKNIGEKHWHWKGGKILSGWGYYHIYQPNHPFCDHHGYIFEHRLIYEKYLGRYLKPEERIHHINYIKADNRIENLMLFPNISEHKKYHFKNRLLSKSTKI